MKKLSVCHDEAHGFWTGKPWLVIREEGEPAVAAFKTDREAFDYIEEQEKNENAPWYGVPVRVLIELQREAEGK